MVKIKKTPENGFQFGKNEETCIHSFCCMFKFSKYLLARTLRLPIQGEVYNYLHQYKQASTFFLSVVAPGVFPFLLICSHCANQGESSNTFSIKTPPVYAKAFFFHHSEKNSFFRRPVSHLHIIFTLFSVLVEQPQKSV